MFNKTSENLKKEFGHRIVRSIHNIDILPSLESSTRLVVSGFIT